MNAMNKSTLGFVGGGRVTKIILQAFQNKKVGFDSIVVFEPNGDTAAGLKQQFPGIELADAPHKAAGQGIVFLAVHPPVMMETLDAIRQTVTGDTTVISLAPKITMEKMAGILSTGKIARMIPNATSYINKGMNPISFHPSFPENDQRMIMKLLKTMGKTRVVAEEMLEAYAIVSAMLPTYFWFQWKKMEEIALKTGFSEAEAKKVIRETLNRSLKLYYKSDLSPEEVMDLIPVKPIGDHEEEIEAFLESKLLGLYEKIQP